MLDGHTLLNKGVTHERWTNVLPVETDAKEPQAFVAIRATKQVGDDVNGFGRGMLSGEADDIDTIQKGENVCRKDLVYEHPSEGSPE